jgi:hypothetical protein
VRHKANWFERASAVPRREDDTSHVGNLKGVGRVYQQTFIDTYAVARPLPLQALDARLAEAAIAPLPLVCAG